MRRKQEHDEEEPHVLGQHSPAWDGHRGTPVYRLRATWQNNGERTTVAPADQDKASVCCLDGGGQGCFVIASFSFMKSCLSLWGSKIDRSAFCTTRKKKPPPRQDGHVVIDDDGRMRREVCVCDRCFFRCLLSPFSLHVAPLQQKRSHSTPKPIPRSRRQERWIARLQA